MPQDHGSTWRAELGERLRGARKDGGYERREELAFAVWARYQGDGPSSDVIGDIERGERRFVDARHLLMIADVLNISLTDLLPPVEDEPQPTAPTTGGSAPDSLSEESGAYRERAA